jgi:hypothetical protein
MTTLNLGGKIEEPTSYSSLSTSHSIAFNIPLFVVGTLSVVRSIQAFLATSSLLVNEVTIEQVQVLEVLY